VEEKYVEKDCNHTECALQMRWTRQAVYKCNIEARSCNHCCSGKAVSITYLRVCL